MQSCALISKKTHKMHKNKETKQNKSPKKESEMKHNKLNKFSTYKNKQFKQNQASNVVSQAKESQAKKSTLSCLLLAPALLANALFALEFGGVGNVSAGMGGAGVALKQSQWTLYYNPALLGIVNKSSFGYSFGAEYKETNLLAATNINTNNIEEMYKELDGLFKGTATNSAGGGVAILLLYL